MRCRRCQPVPEEVRRAADLLERRWVISVIWASLDGAARFNEFRQAVEGVPARTLTERLRELEAAGVLERLVVPASPPYAEYRLTERGRRLAPVLEALGSWRDSAARGGPRRRRQRRGGRARLPRDRRPPLHRRAAGPRPRTRGRGARPLRPPRVLAGRLAPEAPRVLVEKPSRARGPRSPGLRLTMCLASGTT